MFPFVPPPPVRYAPPDAEHVPLHSKSSCKNMARASGGCKYYAPSKLGGGTNEKDPKKKLPLVIMIGGHSLRMYIMHQTSHLISEWKDRCMLYVHLRKLMLVDRLMMQLF